MDNYRACSCCVREDACAESTINEIICYYGSKFDTNIYRWVSQGFEGPICDECIETLLKQQKIVLVSEGFEEFYAHPAHENSFFGKLLKKK